MAGLTPSGFEAKALADILKDIETTELATISPNLDIQADSPVGVINGIVAGKVEELWEVAQAVYTGMDPDNATGNQLTSLSLITGTNRLAATFTQVIGCVVNVNAGFNAAPGTMFASITGSNNTIQFTNKSTVSSVGGGNVTTDFQAVNTGPIQCLATTLNTIAQPLAGWNSITNPNDGTLGSNIESDAELRVRRVEELQGGGASTPGAIRSAVLKQMVIPTTTSDTVGCIVLFNDSDATDGNGLPPHSFEVIANQPGATSSDDVALASLILSEKPAGTATHGTSNKIVTDSQNNSVQINFTRPTATTIYIDITVKTDPNLFPADGVTQIKAALVAYAAVAWQPGSTVYALHTKAQAFGGQVIGGVELTPTIPGVLDVTIFTIDTVFPPVATSNITIDVRHQATLSTGNIAVTVT